MAPLCPPLNTCCNVVVMPAHSKDIPAGVGLYRLRTVTCAICSPGPRTAMQHRLYTFHLQPFVVALATPLPMYSSLYVSFIV